MDIAKLREKLKSQLIKELQSNIPDVAKVQELTLQLSNLDENTIGFSVDAGIIDRLGRELVAKQETAVSELVKNSYDADATRVDLLFSNADKSGGTLFVRDDGTGMSRDEIISGFMRISSTDKIHNPISPIYKRQRAGRKGIGRFAVQRLGHRLTITTKRIEQKKALKVTIDWDKFQNDRELFSIRNRIEEIEVDFEKGTRLTIKKLREAWSEAAIRRIYRYIVDLIQPFPLSDERKALENKQDPGFKANFYQFINGQPVNVIDEDTYIFDYALAIIEGHVDDEGQGYYSINSKNKNLNLKEDSVKIGLERDDPLQKFIELRNVYFKAYYFIYDSDLIPPQQLSRIRKLADEKGGVRLYRNGFRVLPYGETYDDWLKLDYSVRRRVILAPHGNNNFFGFVEVNDVEAEKFEETASREGLLENSAFRELTSFVHRVLIASVIKISEERGRKPTASSKDWKKEEGPPDTLKKAAAKLNEMVSQYSDEISKIQSPELKKEKTAQREALQEISKELDETAEEIFLQIEERSLLRVLASLGLVIGEFTHEIRMYLDSLEGTTSYLIQQTQDTPNLKNIIEEFRDNFRSLRSYASYFDSTISQNVNRELRHIEIRDVIYKFEKVSKSSMKREGISFEPPQIIGYNLFLRPMHPSEWSSIIFNLYTNSKKAIKRTQNKGLIFIRAGEEEEMIYLEFSDNGDGIPEENKDRIFDAFFTTTSPAGPLSDDFEEVIGTGLGLKIVRDIVESYGGKIFLKTPPNGYVTCFRIEIPKATEKEIDENEH